MAIFSFAHSVDNICKKYNRTFFGKKSLVLPTIIQSLIKQCQYHTFSLFIIFLTYDYVNIFQNWFQNILRQETLSFQLNVVEYILYRILLYWLTAYYGNIILQIEEFELNKITKSLIFTQRLIEEKNFIFALICFFWWNIVLKFFCIQSCCFWLVTFFARGYIKQQYKKAIKTV